MRSLSSAAKAAIYAQETGEEFIILLTIDHTDLSAPIRVAGARTDVVSRGDTYLAFPFQIDLPQERDDEPPRVNLVIDNVDRQIVTAVRTMSSAPTVTMEVILASAPDTVEAGSFEFTLKRVRYDRLVVSGEVSYEDILDEQFPGGRFVPANFPALF